MEHEIITDLNNSDIFKVAHQFTSLRGSNFNPTEVDFLFAFITQIDESDEIFHEYRMDVDTLSKMMNRRMRQERVTKLFNSLIAKYITVSTINDEKRYSIFDTLAYNKVKKEYMVRFSSGMKPFFLKLKPYTKGYLSDIFKVESTYSKKIYLLCSQWKRAGSFTIKVDKLMRDLEIKEGSNYLKYGDFKRGILKVAEKNMLEKTNIYFEFQEKKKGKKVDELTFIIRNNPAFAKPKQEIAQGKFESPEETIEERIAVLQGRKIYVSDKLFFFTGIKMKDGLYQIQVKDPQEKSAIIPTQSITLQRVYDLIIEMMGE